MSNNCEFSPGDARRVNVRALLTTVAFAMTSITAFAQSSLDIREANETPVAESVPKEPHVAPRPRSVSPEIDAAKAAADRAREAAERAASKSPLAALDRAPLGEAVSVRKPTIAGLNILGQSGGGLNTNSTPSDSTGAIGPFSYIQLVNSQARIYNRTTGAVISSGSLNQLARLTANNFDPQIIWDPTTERFYYVMDSVVSSTDNRLSYGFSKTSNPLNVTTDWCHYAVKYGSRFPDYPKLGDSQFFIIFGVNAFSASGFYLGSDIIAVSKPAAGTTCPLASTFKSGSVKNIKDSSGAQAATPVPANQIDTATTGYVLTVNGNLPSTKLWLYDVTRNATTGAPVFSAARAVNVTSYDVPPSATQPDFPGAVAAPLIDTSDGRLTQAVQATDPRLGTFSLWTQHTISTGPAASGVRWYEIDPVPATPVVQRQATIAVANNFLFNAAISPDRVVDGTTTAFGNNFVIQYNVTSKLNNVAANIVAASSLNGAPLTFATVRTGVGPYRSFDCVSPTSVCRWGDYSAAAPDPKPTAVGTGQVWGTNQFSGVLNPPSNGVNWRTRIFSLKP